MGRLAELAKTTTLTGAVVYVNAKGESVTFYDEAEAEKALAGVAVEHRRGAFFEKASAPAPAPVAAPAASAEKRAEPKPAKKLKALSEDEI